MIDYLEPLVVEDRALGDEITQLIEFDRAWMPLRQVVEFVRRLTVVYFFQIKRLSLHWRHYLDD